MAAVVAAGAMFGPFAGSVRADDPPAPAPIEPVAPEDPALILPLLLPGQSFDDPATYYLIMRYLRAVYLLIGGDPALLPPELPAEETP